MTEISRNLDFEGRTHSTFGYVGVIEIFDPNKDIVKYNQEMNYFKLSLKPETMKKLIEEMTLLLQEHE